MNQFIAQIIQSTNLSSQEAWWLLEHITQLPQAALLTQNTLTMAQQEQLEEYIHQIAHQHKPLAYIIGWIPFLDLKLLTEPPILIARPETEEWVHDLIISLKQSSRQNLQILDIGTGSGAIALAIAQNFPLAQITALDINPQAIALARKNAFINKIDNITFIESDLFSNFPSNARFDLILSNPPYINPQEISTINPCVTNWEDHQALFSANNGLAIIEQILQKSRDYITDRKDIPYQLVLEIDRNQDKAVEQLCQQYQWQCIIKKDLFGNWRTAWCNLT